MAEAKAIQLNSYITVPKPLLMSNGVRRFPLGTVVVGGKINSFTKQKDGILSGCTRSLKSFSKELGISTSTAWRGRKRLIGCGQIEAVEGKANTYIFKDNGEELFIRIDERLLTKEFDIYDEETKTVIERRSLTLAEAVIAGLIITRCDNLKHDKKIYKASNSDIAGELGLSESCVAPAIKVLKGAKIIVRKSDDVGVNRYKKSTYSVNWRYRRIIKKDKQVERKTQSDTKIPSKKYKTFEELQAERQAKVVEREAKFYEAKHKAEELAERNLARAMADEQFRQAENELKSLNIEIAFAEVRTGEIPAELKSKEQKFVKQREQALKRLRLSESDITVSSKYQGDARGSPDGV